MNTDIEYRMESASEDAVLLLGALLDADGAFVSGNTLARSLGVSRPAVRAKLEKLKEKGYAFEAVRNRGYRLLELPAKLEPNLLRLHLDRLGCSLTPLHYPVVDSTNSEAERLYSHGRAAPFAVLSACQTQGRGRLGRAWHSATADNLYLSVLFAPDIPPGRLQHFTLWAGIHVCRALQSFVPNAPLKVKWPNDLQCGGRKFAGMLTEARIDADRINTIIFGIGVNVNGNPADLPRDLRETATTLRAVHGRELPLNLVAAHVLAAIRTAYRVCVDGVRAAGLAEAWCPLDALAGEWVVAERNGATVSGVASGIDEDGALLLRTEGGPLIAIRAGDVTLRKSPA